MVSLIIINCVKRILEITIFGVLNDTADSNWREVTEGRSIGKYPNKEQTIQCNNIRVIE